MTRRVIPGDAIDEWVPLIFSGSRSAVRLEQALDYGDGGAELSRWLAGDDTPTGGPGYVAWREVVQRWLAGGSARHVTRIRVEAEPPTDYQRWSRWNAEGHNIPAGEQMIYLSRSAADGAGLVDGRDWWLIDDELALILDFDDAGTVASVMATAEQREVEPIRATWRLLHDAATQAGQIAS